MDIISDNEKIDKLQSDCMVTGCLIRHYAKGISDIARKTQTKLNEITVWQEQTKKILDDKSSPESEEVKKYIRDVTQMLPKMVGLEKKCEIYEKNIQLMTIEIQALKNSLIKAEQEKIEAIATLDLEPEIQRQKAIYNDLLRKNKKEKWLYEMLKSKNEKLQKSNSTMQKKKGKRFSLWPFRKKKQEAIKVETYEESEQEKSVS